jgi:predicted O-methyltransferase YrrM
MQAQTTSGEFVPTGHFYSAVPNLDEASKYYEGMNRRDPTSVPGVDLQMAQQWQLLAELEGFVHEVPFGDRPQNGLRYGFDNGAFGHGDGTMLHLMLRHLRPRRVIEVGSGHSSACTLDTLERFIGDTEVTFIEPYTELLRSLLTVEDVANVNVIEHRVQDVELDVFEELSAGDLFFIDSTHVSKAGSDVNYLFFEVLPSLQPGVVIHIHDIFPGFEYPWGWIAEGRAWQEDYLLRAFLQYNSEFEVLLWPSLLARLDPHSVFERVPQMAKNPGGSIYLRRKMQAAKAENSVALETGSTQSRV